MNTSIATPPAVTPHGSLAAVYAQYPIDIVHAEDVWLHTRDGRRVLDCYGGHAVAALGHGHPRWVETLRRQAQDLGFQTNAVALDVRSRAAERLVAFAGLTLDTVFFVNSGAEANENALKIACRYTGRGHVVALEHGWHGRTAAAGAVTWGAREKWYGFPRTPFDVSFASRTDPELAAAAVTSQTACVIVEPVQGLAGAHAISGDVLQALRARCTEVGALLIFDEVQCGVGRTGHPFAANRAGVTPDLLTTAKALGSGFPVSALLLAPQVAQSLKLDDLGTTFGGGPMAAAVVETVIDVIESEGLLRNVRDVSAYLVEHCHRGPVSGSQGAGFLLGLRTTRPAKQVQSELLARDILVGTAADPNILRLLPPYTLTRAHADRLLAAVEGLGA